MKVVRSSPGPSLPPGISWYSFLEAESTPGHMELSDAPKKNPQWPGIDLGTLRLVALTTMPPQAPVYDNKIENWRILTNKEIDAMFKNLL
jgi:hypothetical protein